ncbi:MAG: hypothetical protein WD960_12965 [Gemmatimonadota bacterium]
MTAFDAPFVRKYLIPGAVYQSVLVGGGYGTGREIVEYFTRFGAGGGVFGIGVTFVCWMLVLAVTWEFARVFHVYDYRSFFKELLGRGWVAFEILFLAMFVIVLAVVASAAGEILQTRFGIPFGAGIALMLVTVATLAFLGREVITRSLALWTVLLYTMFISYFVMSFRADGPGIMTQLSGWEVGSGWAQSGFKYAMYNLFIVPAILFSTRALESRREVAASAAVAALICAVPALMFHISFLGTYPGIVQEAIPVFAVITSLGAGALLFLYLIALFGTFVETGAGFIQGTIERIDGVLKETEREPMRPGQRAALATGALALCAAVATFGIIPLVARGYGTLAWGAVAVYVVPVMTLGVVRLKKVGLRAGGPTVPAPGVEGTNGQGDADA